ncbi:double-strand-specific ribonuclease Pac1, partial [Pyrenochaeta sp. MPI-SDFR-AT-0127]
MASSKRGGSFNHYSDRNQQPNKRQMTDRPVYISSRQPTLSASDMQTGLVALLDNFVAEETTSVADRHVLHHARELRRLLCHRSDSKSADAKRELDNKRPDKVVKVVIPDFIERQVRKAKDFPPLPPVAEPHLHEAVFTHRSAHVNPGDPKQVQNIDLGLDYERLELLGDAYIELIASRALYNRFPHVDVPELCSWRERLVENSTLGKFSEAYGFPERLKHHSHWNQGSKAWQKVVADMFEAYVAALVLSDPENGFETAENWLTQLWAPQLLGFKEKIIENLQARNELNKLVLVKDVKLDYRQEKPMTYDSGSIQRFFVGIYLTGWGYEDEWLGSGEGQNKNQAAVAAASAAIK